MAVGSPRASAVARAHGGGTPALVLAFMAVA
jgi:hypothetical protein